MMIASRSPGRILRKLRRSLLGLEPVELKPFAVPVRFMLDTAYTAQISSFSSSRINPVRTPTDWR